MSTDRESGDSTGQARCRSATAADRFRDDPRIGQARQLLLDALQEHRTAINDIRQPIPELEASYRDMLDDFGKMRGGALYFPYLASGLGNGPWVELGDGSVKLDFITGIGVHGFGHSDPRLLSAGIDAALGDTVMHGNLQQGTIGYDFVKLLLSVTNDSGARLEHCFLTTSGSMANENALKIAFQKHAPASRVISFERCFAGRTLAMAQVTDKAKFRDGLPKAIDVDLIPFFDASDPEGSTRRSVRALRDHARRFPGQHACLWMEIVQGEGGYWPGDRDWFRALITEARQHDMAIVADEIQSFGRTTRPWAFQHFGLDDLIDIAVVGKITQVCGTLFRDEYKPRPGLISQTFTGGSWAILAGHAIVQGLVDGGFFGEQGRNVQLHDYFVRGLEQIRQRHPGSLHGPFGIGGMVGLTPFNGKFEEAKQLVGRMYELGVMSFMAGADPARVRFLMPMGCVEESHIDRALGVLEQAVTEME